MATIQIKQSDWLKLRSECGILIYSAGQGLSTQKSKDGQKSPAKQLKKPYRLSQDHLYQHLVQSATQAKKTIQISVVGTHWTVSVR